MSKIKVNCAFCQKETERYPSSLIGYKNVYCSKVCAQKALQQQYLIKSPRQKYFYEIGQKIDSLTIQKISGQKLTMVCDCGTVVTRTSSYLRIQKIKGGTISCGCKSKNKYRGKKHRFWNGLGDISGQQWAMIKHSADFRDIPFELTIEEIWEKFIQQDRKCALTGVELSFAESKRTGQETTASLDRIDSTKPYTKDNIQWIHKIVNKMKNNIPQDEFLYWCQLIAQKIIHH